LSSESSIQCRTKLAQKTRQIEAEAIHLEAEAEVLENEVHGP